MGFITGVQGWFDICKSINITYHINEAKDQNLTNLSRDAEKAFDKVQHPFMIKTIQKIGTDGLYLNLIEIIYDKPTASIHMKQTKIENFYSKIRNKQGCVLTPFLFNKYLENLAKAIRIRKKD